MMLHSRLDLTGYCLWPRKGREGRELFQNPHTEKWVEEKEMSLGGNLNYDDLGIPLCPICKRRYQGMSQEMLDLIEETCAEAGMSFDKFMVGLWHYLLEQGRREHDKEAET